ncbi:MAG TPA: histidine kinase [Panacibacter sp.]|nr:histidine kinase [Panacibacter sp.]
MPLLTDTVRINCLNELGFEYSNPYWSKSKYVRTDSALFYTLQAQKESQQLKYALGIGTAFQNIAFVEEEYGDFIKSEYYAKLAIPIFEKENRQIELNRAKINLGWYFFHQGKYQEAMEIYQKELPFYQTIKDTEHVAMIFLLMGLNLTSQGYYEKAFEYFQKNFNTQKKANGILDILYSPERRADLYLGAGDTANALLYYRKVAAHASEHNIILDYSSVIKSTIYTLQKQYDSALFCLKQNLLFVQTSNTDSLFKKRELMLNALDLLPLYLSLSDFDSVIKYAVDPLKSFANGGDIDNLMPVLKNVTKACIMKLEYKKALYYVKQLIAYAEKTGARPYIRDGYLFLSDIFAAQHKIDMAYGYRIRYNTLNDSLNKDNYASRLAAFDVITKMNTEEKNYRDQLKITEEKNNAKVELINKEKQLQFYVFISGILIVLILTTVFIRNIKLKRKKDQLQLMMAEANVSLEKQKKEQEVTQLQQQKTELEMQALRAQMNPHFIFNCLNSINRFILRKQSSEATEYLTKFSRLIRMILNSSANTLVSLAEDLEALKLYLELESIRFEEKFSYNIQYESDLDIDFIQVPPMLLQPYIENAIWHGLMHKADQGHLDIAISQNDNMLCCKITDDGIGRKEAQALKSKSAINYKSMGMRITADRIAMLHRQYKTENAVVVNDLILPNGNPGGTEVLIKIPVVYL